jgi:putative CRISPR-associated protein (TIGR02620 family)
VNLATVLDAISTEFQAMPDTVEAVLVRWKKYGKRFTQITFNDVLREPAYSARLRQAGAHEFGHVVCSHRGDLFVMWRAGTDIDRFARHLDECQERQCDYVAAYLLVPLQTLRDLKNMEASYIARQLDVPEHLVKLRFEIWKKHHR